MPDALTLIREDHRRVQDLFKEFENSDDRNRKRQIVDQALMELEVHAAIEEEILYPAIRKGTDAGELMNEAEEEHHVAEMIMEELSGMQPSNKNYDAKFMVLAENVRHHIREEEGEMLPKAAELGRDRLQQLGQQLEQRKMELMQKMQAGVPRQRAGTTTRKRATGSRNGGRGRAGRTTRTTARTSGAGRKTTARAGARKTAARKSTSRSRSASTSRSASARSRSGGQSRARTSSAKSGSRASTTARRKTASRSRR